VWPSISLIVPEEYIGIALGFATSLQNFGLVFFPMIIAYIYTTTQSYEITLLFFIFLLIVSSVFSVLIHFEDQKKCILNIVQGVEEVNLEKNGVRNNSSKKLLAEIEEDEERLKGNLNEEEIKLPLNLKNLF
jgi:nitrate/nitrite transporter NarK